MEFDRPYSRQEFIRFLKGFLPIDAQLNEHQNIPFYNHPNFATSATRLGSCDSLDLNVYEVKHCSRNDARVGLSKDAFRLIADEGVSRALVIFVPEDSNDNYRFSLVELTLSWEDNDKIKRSYSNPRRYSYYLGKGVAYYTPNKYLNEPGRILSVEDLRNRFSVEVLTKAFYNELSDWYAWAIKEIQFPNDIDDPHDNEKYNHEAAIRLITRLIFVWFLKQRNLIPWQFFDEPYIAEHLLEGFTPNARADLFGKSTESRYYKAILQNLFFAMLNSPMTAEGSKELTERHFRKLNDNGSASRADFDNNKLMRYEKFFKNPDLFVELANSTVPFLNGGLFDCLDDKENGMYLDAFTDRESINRQLIVPDFLFFGEEVGKKIDLTSYYGYKKVVDASGVIDILKRYNFTVEENTPFDQDVSLDPELLGKVFENLLAAYNPETQTTARKQTGSFYTPRDIVQYMVNEALVAHLNRIVGKEFEEQYRSLLDYSDEDLNLSDSQRKSILEAIFKCKVLDPACGSGAFPVGMLQQMVHILQRIDPDNEMWRNMILESSLNSMQESMTLSDEERREIQDDVNRNFDESCNNPDYARKLYLIENCIYGVDIQPIAIQISKLRFFISLVIDQKTNSDPTENFGIRPLPNLEAKFVAANSLIGLQKKEGNLFDLDDIKNDEKLLRIAKHRIFGAKTLRTKRKWKNRVAELRQKIADALIDNNFIGNEQAADLVAWDMFDQHKYAPFFDPEWMFGVTGGFDIVIGNPPYVQLQKSIGVTVQDKRGRDYEMKLGDLYDREGFWTFAKTGDLYCLFYERGVKLLKSGGHLCFITSNKWMRTGYGEKLRSFFVTETNPEILIDFGDVQVFESATVDTNILLLSKGVNCGKTMATTIQKNLLTCSFNLSDFMRHNASNVDFSSMGSNSWVILSPIELSIKKKIEAVGVPLKDWDINIYRGVLTGYNEAFIISTEKRNEILSNCQSEDERQRTEELIRPILRGRDIKRYGYEDSHLYLINTHNGIKGKLERIHIEDYPAVKAHLDQYWDKISTRADKGDTPYNLRNCAYLDDFFKPKIAWGNLNLSGTYSFVPAGVFINAPSTFISTSKQSILHILNSKLADFYIRSLGVTRNGGYFEYKPMFVDKLPIPPNHINFKELEEISNYPSDIEERRIENLIYSIYGLSEAEIRYLEKDKS